MTPSRTTATSPEADMRAVFVAYLVFIVGGLAYLFTIGFLQR
jgi:hypothetical protein